MERRLSERTNVALSIKLMHGKRKDAPDIDGEIVNISNAGACISSDARLEVNSEISFYVVISSRHICLSRGPEEPMIASNIVWAEQPINETYRHRYGVKFLDPSNGRVSILKESLRFEERRLSNKLWDTSHPEISFPSLPLSSRVLDGLSPTSLSVDVTNLCNLKCKHCFWHSYKGYLPTTTNKGLLFNVKKILEKYPNITNITWYGGEPLININTREILKEAVNFAKNNLIVTNGTFPIPDWKGNIHYAISIDGTEEIHNMLRGLNVYKTIKKHILDATARKTRLFILYCINAVNIDCIPDFLEEWQYTGVELVGFTVYTPLKNKSSGLTLSDGQREKIVSLLKKMKKKYGSLIANSEAMIELISARYGEDLAKNCPMNFFNKCGKVYSIHMCNDGNIRVPCAIGRDASHVDCRSITKVALYAGKVLRDRKSLFALLKMYHSRRFCE